MTNSYPDYKPSDIEWVGDIPAHWDVKKLKYVAKINWSRSAIDLRKDLEKEVVFLAMERVSETGELNQENRKKVKDAITGFTYFERNDVIVAKITPCFENGKGALLDDLETDFGYGSTEFHTIKASAKVLPKFLYALTRSERFMASGEAFMTGSAGQK